ncbi:MAG: hypothetical protein ACI8WB_005138 [Phenylobacterium sp.]|jgi:hypothetical protein
MGTPLLFNTCTGHHTNNFAHLNQFLNKSQYNSPSWYGYGFVVGGTAGDRIVGHSGAYLGVDARLDIHLDSGFVVVILANQSGVVGPVRRKITQLIAQLK